MGDNQLGSGPIQEDLREDMNRIAMALENAFNQPGEPPVVGFILMTFPFGVTGRCNYISNSNRDDVKTMLREQLAYFEGMPDDAAGGPQ